MATRDVNDRRRDDGVEGALSWIFLPVIFLASGKGLPWFALPILAVVSWLTHTGLTLLHELAHFFVGRLCGIGISEVVVGRGRRLLRVVVGSVEFRLHALPCSGHVVPRSSISGISLVRSVAFVSAGVVAEGLVGLLSAAWLPRDWILSHSVAERIAYFGCVFAVLFVVLDVVSNLSPRDTLVGDHESPSDGKILLQLWRNRHNLPAERATAVELDELAGFLKAGDSAAGLALAQCISLRHPDNYELALMIGALHSELGDPDRALETLS